MSLRPTRLGRCAIVLVALLALAPVAAADRGVLSVDLAKSHGGVSHKGDLTALFVADAFDVGTLTEPEPVQQPAIPFIDFRAGHLRALELESRSLAGPDAGQFGQPVPDPTYDSETPAREVDLRSVQATLAAHQPGFQLHVLAMDDPARYQASNDAGSFFPMESVYIRAGAFQQAPGSQDYLDQDPASKSFWGVHFPTPHVGHQEESGRLELVVQGDFVLEAYGLSFEVQDGNEETMLFSGIDQQPVAGPVPLYRERTVLLRVFVEDAVLRLSTQGGLPAIQWASPSIEATPDGPTALRGATGSLVSSDGDVTLQDDAYLLPAGNILRFTPAGQTLTMGVEPTPSGATMSAVRFGAELSAALVGAGAIASLLVAVGLGLLRRRLAPPTLRTVEQALERGQHARAARLAGRILRREPGNQDAALARAIALSKGGKARAAVAHARAHLAASEPTDGSLHYVLGLALLDAGDEAEARAALQEAVQRTPSLRGDVQARLASAHREPLGNPVSPMLVREAHGYA